MTQDTWKNIYIVESSKTEFSGIGEDDVAGNLYWIKGIIRPKPRNNKIGYIIGLIGLVIAGIAFGLASASVIIDIIELLR